MVCMRILNSFRESPTMVYCAILYYTILYYTILYYTILYYTILYYTMLYYTILYYTILYYTMLYLARSRNQVIQALQVVKAFQALVPEPSTGSCCLAAAATQEKRLPEHFGCSPKLSLKHCLNQPGPTFCVGS